MNRENLFRYTYSEAQVYGVRRLILDEGKLRGKALYNITTAGGLDFDVTPDDGLDIGRLRFNGVNISFKKMMCVTPERGGARGIFAFTEGNVIRAGGEIELRGNSNELFFIRRTITVPAWGSEILIEDKMENPSPFAREYHITYSCNFGYPFLDDGTRLELPEERVFKSPNDNGTENIYFNEIERGADPVARVINKKLGIGAEIMWSVAVMPVIKRRENMKSGEYSLSLEPTTEHKLKNISPNVLGSFESVRTFIRMRIFNLNNNEK